MPTGGIPIVGVASRLFTRSVQLMLPRSLAHPVDELSKTTTKKGRKLRSATSDAAGDAAKKGRKVIRNQRKRIA